MDLTVTEYATYDDLYEYVYGSAAVIGLQMVPILEPTAPEAYERAKDLGVAFQLANFVRDVGEDLERGRVYLPLEDLARFGVTRADLEKRVVTPDDPRSARVPDRGACGRSRRSRVPGIAMLHPSSQPCIEAARVLYCGIVDAVEEIDYQVFDQPGHGVDRVAASPSPCPRGDQRPVGPTTLRRGPPARPALAGHLVAEPLRTRAAPSPADDPASTRRG